MKNILKNKLIFVLVLMLSLFLIGCGEGEPGGKKNDFNEANYTLQTLPTLEKQITLEEAKTALTQASNYLSEIKSYSYTQTLYGIYDSEYNYEGITKIDVTGASPMASVELTGTNDFALYVANNKAYLNYDGHKISYEVDSDLSNIIEAVQPSMGDFTTFNPADITEENLEVAGVDKDEATVIKYQTEDETVITIVIHDNKIMKVMYVNFDGVEYVAKYDYTAVTVTLPSDLDEYEQQ